MTDKIAFMKLMFGFLILLVLAGLAAMIALTKVESKDSYGLDIILGGLISMAGGFVNWAFSDSRSSSGDAKK